MARILIRLGLIVLGVVGFMGCPEPPPTNCKTNQDCDSIQACAEGRCVQYPSCSSDADCTYLQSQCFKSFCRPNTTCQSNQDCTHPSQQCIRGYCAYEPDLSASASLLVDFENATQTAVTEVVSGKAEVVLQGATVVDEGYNGRSAKFAGAASLELPGSSLQHTQVTVQMWVKPEVAKRASTLLHFCNQGCKEGYQLSLDAGDRLSFQVGDGASVGRCQTSGVVQAGVWTHVAGSYDGTTVRCFINGQIQGEAPWSGALKFSTNTAKVGVGEGGGQFQGWIDTVAVLPWARAATFLPGQTRFMYLAGDSGNLQVADTTRDIVVENAAFAAPDGGLPVGIAPNGKRLYLWSKSTSSLVVVDTTTKTKAFSVPLSDGGLNNGGWVTPHAASNTLWVWGAQISVFTMPLSATSKPVATFPGVGAESLPGLAFALQQGKFLVSKPDVGQIHQFSVATRTKLPVVSLENPNIQGARPGVMSVNPNTKVLYVADEKASKLYLFSPNGDTYNYFGEFEVVDTDPDLANNPKRLISTILAHPSGSFLFYSFSEPAFSYRLDIKEKQQHVIRDNGSGLRVSKFVSQAPMHLHVNARKVYVRDSTTGRIHVMDVSNRRFVTTLGVGSKTQGTGLPPVGVLHPSQPN
ncbi:MAG: hypothetical protein EP343_15935 [Deltaproteobacteria bacterium]|nr:MAG: hypothetical protein EP343_15935 [Deltaproteobacteria bacterium]